MKKSDLTTIAKELFELGFEPAPQLDGKIGPLRDWVLKALPFVAVDDEFNEGALDNVPMDQLKKLVDDTLEDSEKVEKFAEECEMKTGEFITGIRKGYGFVREKSGQPEPESEQREPEPAPEPEKPKDEKPKKKSTKKATKKAVKKKEEQPVAEEPVEKETNLTKTNLYRALDIVTPGLDRTDYIDQATSFVFKEGFVITFNNEISMRHPVIGLKIEGAVKADELYKLLAKIKEDELEVTVDKVNEFRVKAGRTKAGIKMESKITMPLESIEDKGTWMALPEDFAFYLNYAMASCGNNHKLEPVLTNVYVGKDGHLVGSDGLKIMQCSIGQEMPTEDFLIPADAAKNVAEMNPSYISLGEKWVHFKNDIGTELSCRILNAQYPKVDKFMKIEGITIELPENMKEILNRTSIFSKRSNIHEESIEVTFKDNELSVYAANEYGWIQESADTEYNDEPITFSIAPYLFKDIMKETSEFTLGRDALKFEGTGWEYVTSLKNVK